VASMLETLGASRRSCPSDDITPHDFRLGFRSGKKRRKTCCV